MTPAKNSMLEWVLRPVGALSAAALLMTAGVAPTLVPGSARADDSEACREAEPFIGKTAARRMTAAECADAARTAEEEQWQLWLDLAFAEEASGDLEKAIDTYRRFVKATMKRGPDLVEPWPGLRDDAIVTIDRLEQGLLKSHARIVIQTEPTGLKIRFVQEPRRGEEATPITRFLKPGTHIIAAVDPATDIAREVTFTVEAGQNREIKIDLRPESPVGTTEKALPGDNALKQPDAAPDVAGGTAGVHTRIDDDASSPPRTDNTTTALRRIGVAAIGVGIAAAAAGTGFILTSIGLDGEADCSGALCDFEAGTRARLRNDASIHENRAIGAFVTGGVFLVGGAILVVLDMLKSNDDAGDSAANGLRLKSVFPTVGAGQAGVGATLGF